MNKKRITQLEQPEQCRENTIHIKSSIQETLLGKLKFSSHPVFPIQPAYWIHLKHFLKTFVPDPIPHQINQSHWVKDSHIRVFKAPQNDSKVQV